MSMNILITATREVTFKKKKGEQGSGLHTTTFDAFQTPTEVTYEIVSSDNPVQAYIDWVLRECSCDEKLPIYADDDIFGEGEHIGFEIYNAGMEHVQSFRKWVEQVEEEGFVVELRVI